MTLVRFTPSFLPNILIILGLAFAAQAQQDDAFKLSNQQTHTAPEEKIDPVKEKNDVVKTIRAAKEFEWLDEFHNRFSGALDNSALWLNDQFVSECEENQRKGAKAWAKVILGWEPKTGDLGEFPLKFRVKVNLPNLKHRVNLVFSDNELEDSDRLPLETSRPADDSLHKRDFGAAIQLLHKSSESAYFRSRLGIGSAQLYVRSSYRWKKKLTENTMLSFEPSLEYYMNDGAGYRFLTELSYFPTQRSEFRAFYSLLDRQKFDSPTWKKALYHLTKLNDKSTLITGILVNGITSPDYRDEKVTLSTRFRRHALRKWLFFEFEPFIDFERQQQYDAQWGIALRVGGYFGYED